MPSAAQPAAPAYRLLFQMMARKQDMIKNVSSDLPFTVQETEFLLKTSRDELHKQVVIYDTTDPYTRSSVSPSEPDVAVMTADNDASTASGKKSWAQRTRDFLESKETGGSAVFNDIGKGLLVIVGTPIVLAGVSVFAVGVMLYGVGALTKGLGNLMTGGVIERNCSRQKK